jgi:hypothetical protein
VSGSHPSFSKKDESGPGQTRKEEEAGNTFVPSAIRSLLLRIQRPAALHQSGQK